MSLSQVRYFPNTRETAEEIKRRVYHSEGIVVVKLDDPMSWELRELLRRYADGRYGERKK